MLSRLARYIGRHHIGLLALFVALGGTSYATVLNVPRNSVGTPQLKRNAVKAAKIAPNAVRTAHVLNGSLLAGDFKAGQLPQGPRGEKGEKGDKGEDGRDLTVDSTLPSGKTLTGVWQIGGPGGPGNEDGYNILSVTFQPHLAASIPHANHHFIESGGPASPACTGSLRNPTAAAGHVCVYGGFAYKDRFRSFGAIDSYDLSKLGFFGVFEADDPGSNAWGTWAVTAP